MNSKRNTKHNTANRAAGAQSPKRVSRKSVKRKILIKRIIGLVFSLIVVGASFYASAKLLFVVKTVNVSGSSIFTAKEITDFMAIPMEESMFKVNAKQLEQNLLDEFTYLEEASVVKRFPDIIEVTLADSVESYYTVEQNEYKVYSQGFKYLRNAAEPPAGTVWLDLDVENADMLSVAKNLIELLAKNNLDSITKISVQDENSLAAEYDNRIKMEFGTVLDIEYKIKMCQKIITEKIPQGEKGVIDATNSGEAVYKRQ